MKIEPLDYEKLEEEIIGTLEAARHIVLASSADGLVTARSMSYVNMGLDVYMQTDSRFTKTAQMKENPRVALCFGNVQIEGVAEFLGHPMDEGNAQFRVLYAERHRGSFDRYSNVREEVVFVVRPSAIALWKYIDGEPYRDRLNVAEHIAFREPYEQ